MLDLNSVTVVIMAGGQGRRLHPLTLDVPKPMLKISGKPLLELIILRLKEIGIRYVTISVNYKKEVIENYFRNGRSFGIEISYLHENSLRGTAGCLSDLKSKNRIILVLNGDILTFANFQKMILFHQGEKSELTMGVVSKKFRLPYGIVEKTGYIINSLEEKPAKSYFVNAGIYIINSDLLSLIPQAGFFHMTELVSNVLRNNKKILAYDIDEYWQDIGNTDDYQKAKLDYIKLEGV